MRFSVTIIVLYGPLPIKLYPKQHICKNETEPINQLLYVDDWKLLAEDEIELKEQIKGTKEFWQKKRKSLA